MIPDYIVEAKSRDDLREYAREIRQKIGLDDRLYFPVVKVLEIVFQEIYPQLDIEIVENDDLPKNVHADTDIINEIIRIKEYVYEGACNNNGRDRMTIAHEMAHYLTVCVSGFKIVKNYERKKVPAYNNPEWQAKCLAGELLIPAHLVEGMSVEEVVRECCVSVEAAEYQLNTLRKE